MLSPPERFFALIIFFSADLVALSSAAFLPSAATSLGVLTMSIAPLEDFILSCIPSGSVAPL